MAAGNITISLPQMIDLALNIPENGSVNFNLLQSVLHIVVQQLELVQCQVEFRGKDGEKVQNLMCALKPEASVKITEYVVTPIKDAGKVLNRKHTPRGSDAEGQEGAINIDQVSSQEILQTVVVVETGNEVADNYLPCVISRKYLQEVNSEMNALKVKVQELADLPGNAALIEAAKGAGIDKGTPILDMFQMMTLAKKLEAAEGGIEKLASMVEDLARQGGMMIECPIPGANTISDALQDLIDRINNIEYFLDSTSTGFKPASPPSHTSPPKDTSPSSSPPTGSPPGTQGGRPSSKPPLKPGSPGYDSEHGSHGGLSTDPIQYPEIDTSVPDFSKMTQEEFVNAVREELHKTKEHINNIYTKVGMLMGLTSEFSTSQIYSALKNVIKKHIQNMTGGGTTEEVADLPASERLERLEDRFNGTNEQIASLDSTFNQEITNIHAQFADMEKAFGNIMEKIHFGMPGGDSAVAGETLGELYDKLMGLQSDMENLAETASKLVEDKEDKQRLLEVLTEQVEFLKTVKADKEDLEDALADKADACAINRKVSHDQFDTACDELSKGIEDALGKLTQQEELWQQALNEIQKEIGNKLDRMELGPLRDFVNNKLKMLQQRLKALTALKKETEAAGTKKFLRNVQCISCDKDVVMRKEMDPSLFPQPYALPPSRSMGPYLAYELDALRKQQKSLPNSRNLNHFENALQQKTPRPGEDHICNRYCGGSHTITTPQQRVTRLGHFLNQWGPEAQSVTDGGSKPVVGKEDEKLAIIGSGNAVRSGVEDIMAPKISKIESAEKVPKEGRKMSLAQDSKRGSIAPSDKKRSSAQKISGTGSRQGSAEAVSGDKRRTTATSKKERRSSVSGGSAAKESAATAPGQIPEETPSEVAKEEEDAAAKQSPPRGSSSHQAGPPVEGGEEPPASPDAPAEESAPATEE